MATGKKVIDVRLTVRQGNPDLFNRLSTTSSPTKEVLRLLNIALKWEKYDADPAVLLSLFSHATPATRVEPTVAVPAANRAPEREASFKSFAEPDDDLAHMSGWGGDPVGLFRNGGPPKKTMAMAN